MSEQALISSAELQPGCESIFIPMCVCVRTQPKPKARLPKDAWKMAGDDEGSSSDSDEDQLDSESKPVGEDTGGSRKRRQVTKLMIGRISQAAGASSSERLLRCFGAVSGKTVSGDSSETANLTAELLVHQAMSLYNPGLSGVTGVAAFSSLKTFSSNVAYKGTSCPRVTAACARLMAEVWNADADADAQWSTESRALDANEFASQVQNEITAGATATAFDALKLMLNMEVRRYGLVPSFHKALGVALKEEQRVTLAAMRETVRVARRGGGGGRGRGGRGRGRGGGARAGRGSGHCYSFNDNGVCKHGGPPKCKHGHFCKDCGPTALHAAVNCPQSKALKKE